MAWCTVSQLADRFVKDAHEVVKAGDVVKVRVVEVDIKRKRIGLTMRKHDDAGAARPNRATTRPPRTASDTARGPQARTQQNPRAALRVHWPPNSPKPSSANNQRSPRTH